MFVFRIREQILSDLQVFAHNHNGYLVFAVRCYMIPLSACPRDTLTVSAWHLLELTKDISRAKTHCLVLTLRHTDSPNPRAIYSLIDAEVLPLSILEATYENRTNFWSELGQTVSPKEMLASDEEERKRAGGLGSVMVMSIELPKGDNRSPRNAMNEVRSPVFF